MSDSDSDDNELKNIFSSPSRQNETAQSPPNSAQANDNRNRRGLNADKMLNSRRVTDTSRLADRFSASLRLKKEPDQNKKVQEMRQKSLKKRNKDIAKRRANNGLSLHLGQPKIW